MSAIEVLQSSGQNGARSGIAKDILGILGNDPIDGNPGILTFTVGIEVSKAGIGSEMENEIDGRDGSDNCGRPGVLTDGRLKLGSKEGSARLTLKLIDGIAGNVNDGSPGIVGLAKPQLIR